MNALAVVAVLAATAFVPTLHDGDTVPPVPLVDQTGRAFSLATVRGNAVILSFIYTRCADARMCPLVSAKFARLQRAIGNEPVKLVEITLDPAFDTPAVLRRYGAAYGAQPSSWTIATGAPASIADLAARLDIASVWTQPGTLVHGEAVIVLDRNGAIAREIDGNTWTTDDVLAVAREAAGHEAAPLARLRLWLTAAVERCGGGNLPLNAFEMLGLIAALTFAFGFLLLRSLQPSRHG